MCQETHYRSNEAHLTSYHLHQSFGGVISLGPLFLLP
jgi:hypothetical protein